MQLPHAAACKPIMLDNVLWAPIFAILATMPKIPIVRLAYVTSNLLYTSLVRSAAALQAWSLMSQTLLVCCLTCAACQTVRLFCRSKWKPAGRAVEVSLKIAGVHWWYNSRSHAAELTAGYYNTEAHDGYAGILELCAQHGLVATLTCVEMCDGQHPPEALCGPEGLLRQVQPAGK